MPGIDLCSGCGEFHDPDGDCPGGQTAPRVGQPAPRLSVPKVLLLNGPPRSGKDTLARAIVEALDNTVRIGFADHLKRLAHFMAYGPAGLEMDPNALDDVKEIQAAAFAGMTPRQFYIHVSERVLKPLYGPGYFGDRFVDAARASGAELVVVPDSGFRGEAERVVGSFGAENVLLARLRRDGCTYAGDSRSYIDLSDMGVKCVEVENVTGDPNLARAILLDAVRYFLLGSEAV